METEREAEAETHLEKLHRWWHDALFLWIFSSTIFAGFLLMARMLGRCDALRRPGDSAGGLPRWSWVPLGNTCEYDGRAPNSGPWPIWSIAAVALIIWLVVLVATSRHALKPSRRMQREAIRSDRPAAADGSAS